MVVMVGLGPFPMPLVVFLSAFAIAVAAAKLVARMSAQSPMKVTPSLFDMLFVGLLAARLGFVAQWLPQYLADPWSIIRFGDGGYIIWVGVLAALAFGAWQARKAKSLRLPLAWGVLAGLSSWAVLAGALALMQRSTLKLPTTELATLDRDTTNLSAMAGKPMVVNLWATWCPPCRREMPVLADAQRRHGDMTFAFVNQGEPKQVVVDYLQDENLQFHNVLLDLSSSVLEESGSRGLPTTLFFDASGRLVDAHMGELSEASLAQKLQRLGSVSAANPDPLLPKQEP